jgi:hypothetical protein
MLPFGSFPLEQADLLDIVSDGFGGKRGKGVPVPPSISPQQHPLVVGFAS